MIQYYLDLEQQIKNIKDAHLSQGQIQKIYSTAYYLSLAIRVPGKTWHLYLGRGGGQEGLWLHHSAPPSQLRRRDNFLEYFRRHLTACTFLGSELDAGDRIVKLNYQKYGSGQSLLLFWKGRQLYFAHSYQESPAAPFKILVSWKGKAFIPPEPVIDLFSLFDEVGRKSDMHQHKASTHSLEITDLLQAELQAASLKTLTIHPGFLQRKKDNIEDDLRKARQWEKIQSLLDNQETLDEIYELKVADQKIKFEGELNPYERRNLLFQKIKKLKRGEAILQDRLKSTEAQLAGKQPVAEQISALPMVKPVWGKEENKIVEKSSSVTKEEYKLFKWDHFQLGLGITACGNDQLRNKWASREDWWIHLDGYKSAHAIVKVLNDSVITSDMLNMGASLVAVNSGFNESWIPIIYTQVKYLKGVAGVAGMVTYKKEKRLKCQRVDINHLLKD